MPGHVVSASGAPDPPDPRHSAKVLLADKVMLLLVFKDQREEKNRSEDLSVKLNYLAKTTKSQKTAHVIWSAEQVVHPGCSFCAVASVTCVKAAGYISCARCTSQGKSARDCSSVRVPAAASCKLVSLLVSGAHKRKPLRCVGPSPAPASRTPSLSAAVLACRRHHHQERMAKATP